MHTVEALLAVGDLRRAERILTRVVHGFARDSRGVLGAVEAARRVEASHGADTPVWITELGWATGGPSARRRCGSTTTATAGSIC